MATLRDATDPNETFTNLMLHNEFMNFTKFIKEDMRTYLLAVSGKISLVQDFKQEFISKYLFPLHK